MKNKATDNTNSSLSKRNNSNFTLKHILLFLTVQQTFILFPFFSPDFNVHRWNDDFVVFNKWNIESSTYNFIPKSVDSWLSNVRSRDFLSQFLVDAYKILRENQHLFLITQIVCWFTALVCLAFAFSKIFPAPAALVVTLLVGSSPYRTDFFPYMQGSGYSVVFLLFSIATCLLYFSSQSKRMIQHNIFMVAALITLYISFYFYEIAIIGMGFFSGLLFYFKRNSNLKISQKRTYLEALSFLLIGGFHALVIMTASHPIWNRSGVSNFSFVNLIRYLSDFTFNYCKVILNPFVWLFSSHLLNTQLKTLLQNSLFIALGTTVLFLCIFSVSRLTKFADHQSYDTKLKSSKIDRHFSGGINFIPKFWNIYLFCLFAGSLFLIFSPYIGFLTFAGGFPVRLSVLAIPGFAIIIGITFMFFDAHVTSVRSRSRLLYFYLLIPVLLSLLASYQSQSVSSVSTYDNKLEANLLSKLSNMESINFPIILHIATPACAQSNFWGQAYGGSIWGANNGQLNLANDLNLLNTKDPNLSRILYVPISVNLPKALSDNASSYCHAGTNVTIPETLLPLVPKYSEMYTNHLQYYIDPNLKITEIVK